MESILKSLKKTLNKLLASSLSWIKRTGKRLEVFGKLNFTDLAGRVDTGRIGQFVGLLGLISVTYYTLYVVIAEVGTNMVMAIMASVASGLPILLYKLKEFSGMQGTSYVRPPLEREPKYFKRMRSFFKKNFTDEWGRVDTGRIGQMMGLIALTIIMIYVVYVYTYPLFHGGTHKEISTDNLILLTTDSGMPMILYRLKYMTKGNASSDTVEGG